MEVKNFFILSFFVFFCFFSTGGQGQIYPGGMYFGYPYWGEWGYWTYYYQYPFQHYGISPDTRKNLLQGKILNNDEPKKGSKKVGKKVFIGKVF
jgi:hypothetical protein